MAAHPENSAVSKVIKAGGLIVFAGLFAAMGVGACYYAWYETLGTFIPVDDEGYSMISIKMFNEGLALYDRVFSTFGPSFYLYNWIVFGLTHIPITHDAVRLQTLILWLVVSLVCALLTHRLIKSPVLTAAVFGQSVWHLAALRWDPGHAQGLSILLVALILLAAAFVQTERARAPMLAVIGLLGGLLLLCKVNIGLFSLVPLAFTLLLFRPKSRINTVGLVLGALAMVVMPVALMRGVFAVSRGTVYYCIIVTLSVFSCLIATWPQDRRPFVRIRDIVLLCAALAGASAIPVAFVALRGTSAWGLLDGILLRPWRMGHNWFVDSDTPPFSVLVGMVSMVMAVAYTLLHGRQDRVSRVVSVTATCLKPILAIGALLLSLRYYPDVVLFYCTPFLWLLVATPQEDEPVAFTRYLLCLTAAVQSLTAFPVAGAQLAWSTFLYIPAFAVLVWDVFRAVSPRLRIPAPILQLVPVSLAILVGVFYYHEAAFPVHKRIYAASVALDLPGSNMIRLFPERVAPIQWAVNNLRAHANCVISLPGMYSFNLWHPSDPPTGFNASNWILLLNPNEEEAIIAAIAKRDRVCVVANRDMIAFWAQSPFSNINDRPLVRYIFQEFRLAFERGGYAILVPKSWDTSSLSECLLFGWKTFDGATDYMPLPEGIFNNNGPFSVSAWFKTTESGVILGMDNEKASVVTASLPAIYVGTDGKLRGQIPVKPMEVLTASIPVNDGSWHHVVLSADRGERRLYLDGVPAGSLGGNFDIASLPSAKIGVGFAEGWPAAKGGWFPFSGTLANIEFLPRALRDEEAARLYSQQKADF